MISANFSFDSNQIASTMEKDILLKQWQDYQINHVRADSDIFTVIWDAILEDVFPSASAVEAMSRAIAQQIDASILRGVKK